MDHKLLNNKIVKQLVITQLDVGYLRASLEIKM